MEVKIWKLFTAFLCCTGFLLPLSKSRRALLADDGVCHFRAGCQTGGQWTECVMCRPHPPQLYEEKICHAMSCDGNVMLQV